MERDFIKEVKVMERKKVDRYKELLSSIESVKNTMKRDYKNMQFVENRDLVDYYTYKIKAEEAQYDFFFFFSKKIENEIY